MTPTVKRAFELHALSSLIAEMAPFRAEELAQVAASYGQPVVTNDDMLAVADAAKGEALSWALDREFDDDESTSDGGA